MIILELSTTKYSEYEKSLPQQGRYILGQEVGPDIIVYQAFNPNISAYAVANQKFGGPHYKFSRMSWIKPNFLWMMYRAGWAMKENQQHILAIRIAKEHFEEILGQAVHSTYISELYQTQENWKAALASSEVRLQWDPDHDPKGGKLERKAIQLGLRGEMLRKFGTDWIISIEDITPFVHEQKKNLDQGNTELFCVIKETVIEIANPEIRKRIRLD